MDVPRLMLSHPQRDAISTILQSALAAVEPGQAVKRHVRVEGDLLRVGDATHELASSRQVLVVGGGKAAEPMAQALFDLLGGRIHGGVVIVKHGELEPSLNTGPIEIVEAAHPVPDQCGVDAATRILELAEGMGKDDLVLVAIAGGASALLTLPTPGLSLQDLRETTDLLLRSGATIKELNAVRKHLSHIKGGQLARSLFPARAVSLILSDVVGDAPDVIGSGPTAPDPTTYLDAWRVIEHADLEERIPEAVRQHLQRGVAGEIAETPGPADEVFSSVQNCIVGSNRQAAEAAVDAARGCGFHALLLTTTLEGEARDVGQQAAALARDLALNNRPLPRPACLVLGGETTVTVRGTGKGGRNQELALSAAIAIEDLPGVAVATLATDGGDGPTDAAGAFVTCETISHARELGLDPRLYLEDNNSYRFFDTLGDLLRTGPTLTNVADLLFVFAF